MFEVQPRSWKESSSGTIEKFFLSVSLVEIHDKIIEIDKIEVVKGFGFVKTAQLKLEYIETEPGYPVSVCVSFFFFFWFVTV